MYMARRRWSVGLTAGVLLAGTLAASPGAAADRASAAPSAERPSAAEPTDYSLTVDPTRTGAKIDDSMYGVFYEDINRAADGGLYAELVQNRSFEYSTADHKAYRPLTSWEVSGSGSAKVRDDAGRLHERNRNYLQLDGGSAVTNSGYNTGIAVRKGKRYDFSLWARTGEAAGAPLTVTLRDTAGDLAVALAVSPAASPRAAAGPSTRRRSRRPAPAPPAVSRSPPRARPRST
ncbi:putative Alpha-N-arabinofuranosidase 1 [Streptomyces aurantiacus JA 4570]|uniref:Putative Alpha-N-arabinofuranosidase 1 n=1 Tax=Streptomyces aurantiacus JA 4570 TaxID=1286094 RepID=S3ZG80_9ACTN|nr:putative Alpha-N-arabinofuranosidase 1 [Streptomyces aurantiacus JA 4570]